MCQVQAGQMKVTHCCLFFYHFGTQTQRLLGTDVMGSSNLKMGITFLTQTGARILGNSSWLCFYNLTLLSGSKLRLTDLILHQLFLANNLVLFSRGISQTMADLGLKYFLDVAGCKLVIYVQSGQKGVAQHHLPPQRFPGH